MLNTMLSIAEQYSPVPAGRYPEDGPFNGQKFRETLLIPMLKDAIKSNAMLVVRFDGLLGISSSFLEEAFGGLARTKEFNRDQLRLHLKIVADDRSYEWARLDAEKYISEAASKH